MKLSDREWTVLGVLWDSGGAALGEVTRALELETGWSRNTVLTYLTRMEGKGLVSIDKEGCPRPGGVPGPGPGQLSAQRVPWGHGGFSGGIFKGEAHLRRGA